MLHIFIVHSKITEITSKGIIEKKCIKKDDYLILSFRNYIPEATKPHSRYPFTDQGNNDIIPTWSFWKEWKKIKQIDKQISHLAYNRNFQIYIPAHTTIHSLMILSSHKLCTGFNYIEEGSISFKELPYFRKNYKVKYSIIYLIKNILSYRFRNNLRSFPFFRKDYQRVYGITKESFPKWQKKELVPISKTFQKEEYSCFSNQHIIVGELLVEIGKCTKYQYYELIQKLIFHLNSFDIKRVYFKHHPSFTWKNEINIFLSKQNIDIVVLPDNYSLEVISITSKNVNLYAVTSSTLLYAKYLSSSNPWSLAYEFDKICFNQFLPGRNRNEFDIIPNIKFLSLHNKVQ